MTEDTYRTGRAHQLLAHIELDGGKPTRRWRSSTRVGRCSRRRTRSSAPSTASRRRAALAKLGRKEEAAALAMQISGIIADAHAEDAARSYSTLAEVYEEMDDRDRALELYELAAELLGPKNPNRYLAGIYARMAELYEAEGRMMPHTST